MVDPTEAAEDAMIDPTTGEIIDQKDLADRLFAQAKKQGCDAWSAWEGF